MLFLNIFKELRALIKNFVFLLKQNQQNYAT
ncbi:hypothetical protein J2X31_003304 [Flavobacterium arsenatis]|uniref:Uncharacterized protein n=1 Tax=Flavobacterium arsenatis TaxID=1484332 RepID=A0ABU1TTQ8_9FLAO|nr:hypothetical protein [Flavobacterium arsenatis]